VTLTEKINLLMVCEIYEHLEIAGEFDPAFVKSAVLGGHMWALEWDLGGLSEPAVPRELAEEVGTILDMWSYIEYSFGELDSAGRADLQAKAPVWGKDPKFRGFDGNHETLHMSVAAFMVEKMRRFSEFKGRSFNSHSPEIEMSRRMLREFQSTVRAGSPLSADQLATILNAR